VKGPERLRNNHSLSYLSFLPSADLDLNENQRRIDETTKKGDDNNGYE
jgi:hypothetical protein